jgi:phosphoglycolate phosphatase-like HAD superfamily hydrolase
MLLEIGQRFNISLTDTVFIGDSIRDIEAAHHANAASMLVRTGKGMKAEQILKSEKKFTVPVYDDLSAAVDAILQ